MLVCVACTWRGVVAVVSLERKPSDRPTLDGLDFLRHTPAEAELLEALTWLNDNVEGPQVVAEAFTDRGYDESARVAQYTGLPILLGWPHHIKQRGRTRRAGRAARGGPGSPLHVTGRRRRWPRCAGDTTFVTCSWAISSAASTAGPRIASRRCRFSDRRSEAAGVSYVVYEVSDVPTSQRPMTTGALSGASSASVR